MISPLQQYEQLLRGKFASKLSALSFDGIEARSVRARELFAQIEAEAKVGDPLAMCLCASCLRDGWGCAAKPSQSFYWALQACNAEYFPGVYELGICYELGCGVEKNDNAAVELYRRAANADYEPAVFHLAMTYKNGNITERNHSAALSYLMKSVELGGIMAAYELANWYEEGCVIEKNHTKAVEYYSIAATRGSGFALDRLARAYSVGDLGLPINKALAHELTIQLRKSKTL
jgi:uncharacterized protein